MRPADRQKLVELGHRLVADRGQLAVAVDQGVGGHHARPAGVGDDRQPVALGGLLPGQQLGAVEHVLDLEDALDAGPLKGRFVDGVHAGHGAGVRGRRLGRLGEPPRLVGHDRLGAGKGPRRRHELAGLADRLDVEDDRAGLRGRAEIVDQIAHAHVEHVPHGNEIGKADALVQRPIEHRRAERAGLGDEADVPLGGRGGGEAGVQVDPRHDQPQAVGAENPHAVELALLLADELFELSPLRADLAEAGRDDHQPPGAGLAALPHQRGDGGGRRADHGQVRGMGQAGDVLVRLNPLHRLALRVDRVDHAAETRSDQVPQHGVSDAGGGVAGADHGHAMRLKNLVQIPDAHSLLLSSSPAIVLEAARATDTGGLQV